MKELLGGGEISIPDLKLYYRAIVIKNKTKQTTTTKKKNPKPFMVLVQRQAGRSVE